MTHSSTSPLLSFGSTFLGRTALHAFVTVARVARALRHRAEVRQLAEFDDHMLKDIGLTRSDVAGALDESIFENPSVLLVRSLERRSLVPRAGYQRPADPTRPARPVVASLGAARPA